jgi:6-phosphogluconolactonase
VTVFRIAQDGTLAEEVRQPTPLDTGIFAHQICVMPSNEVAILVCRGNDASSEKSEDPGALKVFKYCNGVLTNRVSIEPGGGYGFGPRNIDIHPSRSWIYVSLERQNKLQVFKIEGDEIGAKLLFESETLIDPRNVRPRQMAGAVHVHPNGRFVYLANRAFGTTELQGKKVFIGGENTIVVYAIDEHTGKPTMIQSVDTGGIYPRTFSIDPSGSILVVANLRPLLVRDGATLNTVSANLSVFSIGGDGALTYVRKHDIDFSREDLFWSGMVCPSPGTDVSSQG